MKYVVNLLSTDGDIESVVAVVDFSEGLRNFIADCVRDARRQLKARNAPNDVSYALPAFEVLNWEDDTETSIALEEHGRIPLDQFKGKLLKPVPAGNFKLYVFGSKDPDFKNTVQLYACDMKEGSRYNAYLRKEWY